MGSTTTRLSAGALAVALLLAGTVAWAVTRQCKPNVSCAGTSRDDALTGTRGRDHIHGWAGDDIVNGRRGSDRLLGGRGEDTIRGQRGDDKLIGGRKQASLDDDRLHGGRGDDTVYGRAGIDFLYGDRGDDVLDGGAAADNFSFGPDWGHDRIVDTPNYRNMLWLDDVPGDLYINLNSRANAPEVRTVHGTSRINWTNNVVRALLSGTGDDTVWGDDTRNLIMLHWGGSDTAYGGAGNDIINVREFSAAEPDTVDCGPGDGDRVLYDEGVDTISNCEILNPDS